MTNREIKVLHLSHTDIKSDSRILKEMNCLNKNALFHLYGIGVNLNEGNVTGEECRNLKIDSVNLLSKKMVLIPRFLRHLLTIVEMIFRFFVRGAKYHPDVIHSHDVVALPVAVLIKIFTRSKLIYDAHELESDRNGLTANLSKWTLFAEKRLWSFIDYFITVSPSIKQWYIDKLGKKSTEVILNSPIIGEPPDQDQFYSNNYLREKYGINESEKIFIYVGILSSGRGVNTFVEIFSSIENGNIVFLGYGELESFIKDAAKMHKRVHFHEAVKHSEVVNIVKSADVGICLIENVSLSDYFSLPNKLFEYAFANVKVLASDFPDISEVVSKYNLGSCCQLDFNSIHKAVMEFAIDENPQKNNLEGLYELSWQSQEQKLKKLYKRVLEL